MIRTEGTDPQPIWGAAACTLAREYLLSFAKFGVTSELLDHYLEPNPRKMRPTTINGVYRGLLSSAQNAHMKAGVIGEAIGGVDSLGPVLFGFDPRLVSRSFKGGWPDVLDTIETKLQPRGKVRRAPGSIWPHFCRAVLSGAKFLSQFTDADDFYRWVDVFDNDDRMRPALPMLLSCEIDGLGFPLACDFLKELGYLNYGKPDVHIRAILKELGFAAPRANDYEIYKALVSVARAAGRSPYHVDKMFWLVGSGYFYDHKTVGQRGRVPTDRSAFIARARRKLGKLA